MRAQSTRRDADANRHHIVSAAAAVFARNGLDAPTREIAHRAGLGVATVYRHFPSRADLVTAVVTDRVHRCAADLRAALADPDPWSALSGTVRHFAARQVSDQRLNEALTGFDEERRTHAAALDALVARARTAGAVRADLSASDVRTALMAIAAVRTRGPATVTRLTDLLLAGMAA
ncbi:helix-turn-helix domain-containing protein [Dactylosporangium sp. AC04546]|uniref:TetR/AcrR family transcriptional regulator n=1 Tax=Dactylosporangium sp. AC04546 TaxID=2862460 RepID=UPI001EDDDC11|nr:TetR/AcrR family transcriptional regulator [Dactylosporangium sp. AC04546]WVK78155.1 helix-turn-helix domain-containing protein [Dactylosporangium sp. AC04546]